MGNKTISEIEKARYDLQNLIKDAINYYQSEYGMTFDQINVGYEEETRKVFNVLIEDHLDGSKYVSPNEE